MTLDEACPDRPKAALKCLTMPKVESAVIETDARPKGAIVAAAPSYAVDPDTQNQPLVIYVTRADEIRNCHFWIGGYRVGSVAPQDLLESRDVNEVYKIAVDKGLAEDEPLLLSDTQRQPSRSFYLLPNDRLDLDGEHSVHLIREVIKAMRPQRAGLYFDSNLFKATDPQDLLIKTIASIRRLPTKELYLYAGSHGVNRILNTALTFKQRFEEDIDILVFH